ncbi:MAG: AbrB/MazE/SpoVT family DNA-binding domain-containing protein [Propionicimonas sp.]|uniref:AbrB/MazE/SpoVT family DNA-binding domain-containing protein n=1 Tax=Propionicimonas sp. TaxID=1955623 RepID=UPI003D0E735E
MSGTRTLTMGDRGRLVIPAEVRSDLNWKQGTRLILTETDEGLLLMTVDQARAMLRAQIGDRSLSEELIAERHAEAAADAAAEAARP